MKRKAIYILRMGEKGEIKWIDNLSIIYYLTTKKGFTLTE